MLSEMSPTWLSEKQECYSSLNLVYAFCLELSVGKQRITVVCVCQVSAVGTASRLTFGFGTVSSERISTTA